MSAMQMGLAALGVVVVLGVLIFLGRGKRRWQLGRMASHLGFQRQSGEGLVKSAGLLDAPLFECEESRCENILSGEVRGIEALVFEYATRHKHRWRTPDPVAFFKLAEKKLPAFELRPRNSSSDPSGLPFTGRERFAQIYALSGDDEQALRGLFENDILTFFERSENQDWAVVSSGDWLGVSLWPLGKRPRALDPKQVVAFIEDAKQVLFLLTGTSGRR